MLRKRAYNMGVIKRLRNFVKKANRNNIGIDIGCGEGWLTKILKENGYYTIGADKDNKMLKLASKNCNCLIKINADNGLPFKSASFDFIICSDLLEHLNNPKTALKEIYRILKFGGKTLLKVPSWYFDLWLLTGDHHQIFSGRKLDTITKKIGFKIEGKYSFMLLPIIRKVLDGVPQCLVRLLSK